MCSSTSCSGEALLPETLVTKQRQHDCIGTKKILGWLTPRSEPFSPSLCAEASSQLLYEPEERGGVWICGPGNTIEQGEQHKRQPTAKPLAFCAAHNFALDLLL